MGDRAIWFLLGESLEPGIGGLLPSGKADEVYEERL